MSLYTTNFNLLALGSINYMVGEKKGYNIKAWQRERLLRSTDSSASTAYHIQYAKVAIQARPTE